MKSVVQKFILDSYASSQIGWRQAANELGIWEHEEFELMLERNNIVRLNKVDSDEHQDIQNFAKLFNANNNALEGFGDN